jgi:hypothetical protein
MSSTIDLMNENDSRWDIRNKQARAEIKSILRATRTIRGKVNLAPRVRGEIKGPRVIEPRGRIRLDVEKVAVRDDQYIVDGRRTVRIPRVGQCGRGRIGRQGRDLLPSSCSSGRTGGKREKENRGVGTVRKSMRGVPTSQLRTRSLVLSARTWAGTGATGQLQCDKARD